MNLHVFSNIYWQIRGKVCFYKEVRSYFLKKPSDYIYGVYRRRIEMMEENDDLFNEQDHRLWEEVCIQAIRHSG